MVDDIIYNIGHGKRREIILALYENGPMSLAKLRSELSISPSSLLFEISALEALGVVRRDENLVTLTDVGNKAAAILTSLRPFKSLPWLEWIGLKPLIVWLLVSPYSRFAALGLLAIWAFSLLAESLLFDASLVLFGVLYSGKYAAMNEVKIHPLLSLFTSFASLLTMWIILRKFSKRIVFVRFLLGLFPLLLYPPVHLTLLQLASPQALAIANISALVATLFTAGTLASLYSFETGFKYETVLAGFLFVIFVIPTLIQLYI